MLPLLTAQNLVLEIPDRTHQAPINLRILPGQCWGILGPNGAGKTTLLQTLAGLKAPRSGVIHLRAGPLHQLHRQIIAKELGVTLQHPGDEFPGTVLDTTLMGRHPHLRRWQQERPEDYRMALAALQAVELAHLAKRNIGTLSGGERQRVAIATLLTQDAPLWLLDEPTNHLDLHHQIALLERISDRVQTDTHAAMLSLHDPNLAARYCSHLLLVYATGECCLGTTTEIFRLKALEHLLQHPLSALETPDRMQWVVPDIFRRNRCHQPTET